MKRGLFSTLNFLGLSVLLNLAYVQAQDSAEPTKLVITTEGVGQEVDKHHRGPVLSVNPVYGVNVVKLLVDAYVPATDFAGYPLQFDFYVNRQFFASQIRSKELPGAIGVDIATDVAIPPFNYTIVAKVLHPNREFTTVAQGAIFARNLVTTFDCTLTQGTSEETAEESSSSKIYVANSVTTNQVSNDTMGLKFDAKEESSGDKVTLSASVVINSVDSTANGTLLITKDGLTSSVAVTGTSVSEGSSLKEISLSSEDETTTLACL